MTPNEMGALKHVQQHWRLFVENIEVWFGKIDIADNRVKCRYVELDRSGWSELDEFDDYEITGKLRERINPKFGGPVGPEWSKGWKTKSYQGRFDGTEETVQSITKGIWGVRDTSVGTVLTHLPSGMTAYRHVTSKKRAKKTAYLLESNGVLNARDIFFRPFWQVGCWARGETQDIPSSLAAETAV